MDLDLFFNAAGTKSQLLVTTTRERSKKFLMVILRERFYIAIYFTFVIFLLGLSTSLRSRYKDQFITQFVKNTLPTLGPVSEMVTWETFENILNEKNNLVSTKDKTSLRPLTPCLKRLDIYNDIIVLQMREPWDKVKNQSYLGVFPLDVHKLDKRGDEGPLASSSREEREGPKL